MSYVLTEENYGGCCIIGFFYNGHRTSYTKKEVQVLHYSNIVHIKKSRQLFK